MRKASRQALQKRDPYPALLPTLVIQVTAFEPYPTEAARMSTLSATPRFSTLRPAFDGTKEDGEAGFERRRRVKRAFAQAPLVSKKLGKLTKFLAVIRIDAFIKSR